MPENEIIDLSQRFYSVYCNCLMKDERRVYLDISNKLRELLDIKRYTKIQNK